MRQLFILSMLIILIGGGVALLWQYQQGNQNSHAVGDVSVVGPPTVASATVDAIFARMGSPMVGTGKVVEQASRQANIDDAFALCVWWTETNDGAAGVGLAYRNPGSVRGSVGYPSGIGGYTIYPSYTAAILYWFNLLRNHYVGSGLNTVYTIARPYVGTTSYPLWAGKVIALMYNYRGIAPPPPPSTTPKVVVTPKPKPQPTISPAIIAANAARQRKFLQLLPSYDGSIPLLKQSQAQKPGNQRSTGTQQASLAPALPLPIEYAIVLFGLLAALAIALYALRLKVVRTQAGRAPIHRAPARGAPTMDERAEFAGVGIAQAGRGRAIAPTMDERAEFAGVGIVGAMARPRPASPDNVPINDELSPSTDDLPVLSMEIPDTSVPVLSCLKRETEPLLRRGIWLPAYTEPGTPVATGDGAGRRSTGLLSRYREAQQQ